MVGQSECGTYVRFAWRRVQIDQVGTFFSSRFALWDSCEIVFVDEHLIPPPPSIPTAAPSLTAPSAVAVPSISPLTKFADLSLRSPPINLPVSNSPASQQHSPRKTSLPTPFYTFSSFWFLRHLDQNTTTHHHELPALSPVKYCLESA